MPINSASTPPFSQRSFDPVLHADQVAAMEEEERAITKEEVADCPSPCTCDDSLLELAQPQGGLAPLPAYQPITSPASLSLKMQAGNHMVLGGTHQEVMAELIAHIPKVEEPIVSEQEEMFYAKPVEEEVVFRQAEAEVKVITTQDENVEEVVQDDEQMSNKLVEDEVSVQKVEEEVIINQAENEVEDIITAKQDPEMVVYSKIQEEEVNENKVSFSVEDLEYDDATGQLFIHLESGVREVSDLQTRDQLLARMSSVPYDDQLLANMFPTPKARAAPILSPVPGVEEAVPGIPSVPPKPINFRLQEQRLTYGHLSQSRAQSLGRWTSWTRDLLISDLEAAFTRPRRGIFWSDFSPEEKLARFDMVDWGASYPLDPPPRSLMFEPAEDHWSAWA